MWRRFCQKTRRNRGLQLTDGHLSSSSIASGALPTAMATHHLTRSRRRSSGDGIRSALCSHPAPATPGSHPFHNLHAAACAVLCGGTQEPAHSLCGRGERANPGQHGSTACPRRDPPCPRAPRAHPHCPPVRLPARRTLWCTHPPETRAPAGVADGLPLSYCSAAHCAALPSTTPSFSHQLPSRLHERVRWLSARRRAPC